MTLSASFAELALQLDQLARATDNVLWAVVQAQPSDERDHALIDQFEANSTDLADLARRAHAAARQAQTAVSGEPDLRATGTALSACQDYYNSLWCSFYSESFVFAWREHRQSVRHAGAEWATWVQGVDDALGQCPAALFEAARALFRCWQDLVEWAGLQSISIQITGQEIHASSS
jgi:hypothetical protein